MDENYEDTGMFDTVAITINGKTLKGLFLNSQITEDNRMKYIARLAKICKRPLPIRCEDLSVNGLIDALHLLDPVHRRNAVWRMRRKQRNDFVCEMNPTEHSFNILFGLPIVEDDTVEPGVIWLEVR